MKKEKNEHIEKILSTLPTSPWVYQMKDSKGGVLYVGKSVNLKSRVSSYFRENADLNPAKKQMVTKVRDIEIIICQTEVEALVLETNLIKHLSPKYNILMKDDKNLTYIKITSWIIPEILKSRKKINDGWVYYWPYTQWADIHENIKNLKRIFKIRNCKLLFQKQWKDFSIFWAAKKGIPCMDYYIGICPGPCQWTDDTIQEHADNVMNLRKFLDGGNKEIISRLESKMRDYAKNLEFEKAGKLKSQIDAMKVLSERQIARDVLPWNHDILAILQNYGKVFVWLLQIRSGKMIGVFRTSIELNGEEYDRIIVQFLARQYMEGETDYPDNLFITEDIQDPSLIAFFHDKNITLKSVDIWVQKELYDFTMNQVREYAYKSELQSLEQKTLTREHMTSILTELWYVVPKKWEIHFECYDISHTHGQFTIASRVHMLNGKMENSLYRKYKIKTLAAWDIDDFASHKEVMERRTIEGLTEWNFPNLILIDGGKCQLSSALQWVKEWAYKYSLEQWLDINEVMLRLPSFASIAKREEEIFVPHKKESILFGKWTPELMILQKLRDESHRFAITANRSSRTKAMKKNILEEIPGIWPVTRKKLLRIAGSIENLSSLPYEEIMKVCTESQYISLREHWII